jgi:hypothetical protein
VVTKVAKELIIDKTILREEVEVSEMVFVNRYNMYRPFEPPGEPPIQRPPDPPDEPPTQRPPTRPEDPPPPQAPEVPVEVPQTGNTIEIVIWIVLGSLGVVFIIVCLLSKRRDKNKLNRWKY